MQDDQLIASISILAIIPKQPNGVSVLSRVTLGPAHPTIQVMTPVLLDSLRVELQQATVLRKNAGI